MLGESGKYTSPDCYDCQFVFLAKTISFYYKFVSPNQTLLVTSADSYLTKEKVLAMKLRITRYLQNIGQALRLTEHGN